MTEPRALPPSRAVGNSFKTITETLLGFMPSLLLGAGNTGALSELTGLKEKQTEN